MIPRRLFTRRSLGPVLICLVMLLSACDTDQSISVQIVDANGNPYADSVARIACFGDTDASTSVHNEVQLDSNGVGKFTVSAEATCSQFLALIPVLEYPAAKAKLDGATGGERQAPFDNAFVVYASSWRPGKSGPSAGSVVEIPNEQDALQTVSRIEVRRDQPLVLFNVVAGLEWPLAKDAASAQELKDGLAQASRMLNAVTQGQMAFGDVLIHADGEHWNTADIRIKADNDYRPSAFIGGIINQPLDYEIADYTDRVQEMFGVVGAPWGGEAYFKPGEIYLGRQWDGSSAAVGAWDEPAGFQTIMHEWGHYGLAWGDQYRSLVGPAFCPCETIKGGVGCPSKHTAQQSASVMAYQYKAVRAAEAADITPDNNATCVTTPQHLFYGVPEWESLLSEWANVFDLGAAPALANRGVFFAPDSAELDYAHVFFNASIDITEQDAVGNPGIAVTKTNATIGHVYTFNDEAGDGNGRAIYQGVVRPDGAMDLTGVRPNDRVLLFLDDYAGRQRQFLTGQMTSDQSGVELKHIETWQASLYLTVSCDGDPNKPFDTMNVTVQGSTQHQLKDPQVQLCSPDSAELCTPLQAMSLNGDLATFTFEAPSNIHEREDGSAELPNYGVIRVVDGERELLSWYQNEGGGGSAHMTGDTPLADGAVDVETFEHIPGRNNLVLSSPINSWHAVDQFQDSDSESDNDNFVVSAIIGTPLDLSIMQPGKDSNGCVVSDGLQDADDSLRPFALNIYYDHLAAAEVLDGGQATLRTLSTPLRVERGWGKVKIMDAFDLGNISQQLFARALWDKAPQPDAERRAQAFIRELRQDQAAQDDDRPDESTSAGQVVDDGKPLVDVLHWFRPTEPLERDRFFVITVEEQN